MVFLLVDVIRDTTQMGPHTVALPEEQWFPSFEDFAALLGLRLDIHH